MRKKNIDFTKRKESAPSTPGPSPGAAPVIYIRDLYQNKDMYTVDDIMKVLSISRATAYRIIANFQKKLPGSGKVLGPGEIPREFFDEQLYLYKQKGTTDDEGN